MDYLSVANRDILVTEDGSFTQRYVYDENSTRISAEYGYAAGTKRGEGGENLQSDFAANDVRKVWYRTSHLGSTLFAVDENGKVISHTIYDPWGNPLTETYTDTNFSGIDNSNNYTGYTWDEVLDLYFAQNRFYDPVDHRFTQEDPIKDGENWYAYCGNNPIIVVDVYGTAKILAGTALATVKDTKWISSGYVQLRELISIINTYCATATVQYAKKTHTAYGSVNGKSYTIPLSKLTRANAGNYSRNTNYKIYVGRGSTTSAYFDVLLCGNNSTTYVKVSEFVAALGLSSKVHLVSTRLENYITQADVLMGVRLATYSGVQYLDETVPVEKAVYAAEPTFASKNKVTDVFWFMDQVNHAKPWDIKRADPWKKTIKTTYPISYDTTIVFQSRLTTPEALGNITYGYLGKAMGYTEFELISGGNYAAGGVTGIFTGADSEDDKKNVRLGIKWYEARH